MYSTGISNDTTASKGNTFSASDDSPADRAREGPERGKGNCLVRSQRRRNLANQRVRQAEWAAWAGWQPGYISWREAPVNSIQIDEKPRRQQRTQRGRCCTGRALPPHPRGGAAARSTSSEPSSPSKPPPACSTSSAAGRGQRVGSWHRRGWWRHNTPAQYGQCVICRLKTEITKRRLCSLATSRSLMAPNSSCIMTISSFIVLIQVLIIFFPSLFNM